MIKISSTPNSAFVRLELVLVLASIALLFQLFPSLWFNLVTIIDIRKWPHGTWISVNVVILLFRVRFGPELSAEWCQKCLRICANRKRDEKQLSVKQERALYARMHEARKRQVI